MPQDPESENNVPVEPPENFFARALGYFRLRRDLGATQPELPTLNQIPRNLSDHELRAYLQGMGMPERTIDGFIDDVHEARKQGNI